VNRLAFLADLAVKDERQIDRNQAFGDELEEPRTIQFLLLGETEKQAEAVRAVIASSCHCRAFVSDDPGWNNIGDELPGWRVVVWIEAPSTKAVLGSISALMAVLALEGGMLYCGWSGALRTLHYDYPLGVMRQVREQGWRAVTAAERKKYAEQLQCELSAEHALAGVELKAKFRRDDCEDVVYELADDRVACIRHRSLSDTGSDYPYTVVYASVQEWLDADREGR
jgi:hypothetical protein